MPVIYGKYAGKTTEELVLKRPDWAQWMVENYPGSPVSRSIHELVTKLNRRKFTKKCAECGRAATQASAFQNTGSLMFWCDHCNPYGSGARDGTLTVVSTFRAALLHVDMTCDGRRTDKRRIIKEFARGKGLQRRVGAAHAADFFAI